MEFAAVEYKNNQRGGRNEGRRMDEPGDHRQRVIIRAQPQVKGIACKIADFTGASGKRFTSRGSGFGIFCQGARYRSSPPESYTCAWTR